MTYLSKVSEETKLAVLDYFNSNDDNRIPIIAEKFDMTYAQVNNIIDQHFKQKMKNK